MGSGHASRTTVIRRRAVAVALVALATAALWLLLLRGDDPDPGGDRERAAGVPAPVADLVAELGPEELADQVLLVGFDGTDGGPIAAELRGRQLGGVLLGPGNWSEAGAALVEELRAAGSAGGRIPPLVATTQEGGRYRALADLPPEQTELEVGDSGSVAAAEAWGREGAEALREAGFDLNLAPVADVATLDSPVADRAFSDDPAVVADMTVAALRGCASAGLACAALHFPGLGGASGDTSRGPATVGLDAAGLAARDLVPFDAAFDAGMPAVVVSLALYSAYDPVTPGALAEPIATGLLRSELGFEGVAITDDLGSGAVRSGSAVAPAAVEALAAGSDLLQIGSPRDQEGVRDAILTALESGALAEERLAEAAGRVLELKRSLGLLDL